MPLFDRTKLSILPLSDRKSQFLIRDIMVSPDSIPPESPNYEKIKEIAEDIINARKNNKPVILAFGAHLIKNGLAPIIRKMIEQNYITHLATNGAGSIHDWEFAFQGSSTENVREYVKQGQFGIWEETGKYINLAIILGAHENRGYGESIGKLISEDRLIIPEDLKNSKLERQNISPGEIQIQHPSKQYSIQEFAFKNDIPLTIHPGFGYDIIYTHPLNDGASIGKTSEIDFLKFADSISNLEGGVYLSVGSAIMSPMIFEKSLSMARNLAHQKNQKIENFIIVINDIKNEGNWEFGSGREPDWKDPSFYDRLCKTFDRMGSKKMFYIKEDNKTFLLNLHYLLKNKK